MKSEFSCEDRTCETCGNDTKKIYKQTCPSCGATGEVRNNKGRAQYSGDIYLIEFEGEVIPVCSKCGVLSAFGE